jgi:hypothetical protein
MTSLFTPIDARSFSVAHALAINGRNHRVACGGTDKQPLHRPGEVTEPS